MAPIDWTFLAVLLVSMLIGAWRGLVYELLSLAAWVVAFFAAQWGAAEMADWLPLAQWQDSVRYAVGFAVVFVLVMFACSLLAWLMKKGIEAAGLRPADRSLGAVFGVLRGVLLLLVATAVVTATPMQQAPWWQQSAAAPWMLRLLHSLGPSVPPSWRMPEIQGQQPLRTPFLIAACACYTRI